MKHTINQYIFTLVSLLITALIIFGFALDIKPSLTQAQLETAFYISGIFGLLTVNVFFILKKNRLWKSIVMIALSLIVWRIAYFPVLVLAGYLATLGESIAITLFDKSVVYPFLLLSIALMNAFSMLIAGSFLYQLFNRKRDQIEKQFEGSKLGSSKLSTSKLSTSKLSTSKLSTFGFTSLNSITAIISIPLVVLAIGVSFTQPADWHAIPDTSILDDKPLPTASLPEINPYAIAFEKQGLSWKHQVLFKAAEITYDLIPDDTRWSQIVKGTLEKEFIETTDISTAFCTKVHLRAFMTAQPFLNGKKSIDDL